MSQSSTSGHTFAWAGSTAEVARAILVLLIGTLFDVLLLLFCAPSGGERYSAFVILIVVASDVAFYFFNRRKLLNSRIGNLIRFVLLKSVTLAGVFLGATGLLDRFGGF